MKILSRVIASVVFFSCAVFAQTKERKPLMIALPIPPLGRCDATLTVERRQGEPYEVEFGVVLEGTFIPRSRDSRISLVNGSETKEFTNVNWRAGQYSLSIGEYDGELTLKCVDDECSSLAGEYTRLTRMGQMHYKVTANCGVKLIQNPAAEWTAPSLGGDWVITMWGSDESKKEVAPAHFQQMPAFKTPQMTVEAEVEGTVAAVSGDYGNMHGVLIAEPGSARRFRLSRFDGNHTNLMEGTIEPDGSLKGTIAFSPLSTVHFTAVRKGGETAAQKAGEEAESLTKMRVPAQVFHFAGEDATTGKVVTEADFKGKALIVDIFGTWCPNCHDEAPLLVDVYRRYHAQGLEMVGLSFEYTAEKERNTRLVEFFRKKYGIDYALLLSGSTEEAGKKLPQLEGFSVYPTTIFIDRAGKVRAIHAGFEGKATGQLEDVKKRFEELVQEIVK